jgi:hypothetical protein
MCISKDKVSGVNVENSGVRCQEKETQKLKPDTHSFGSGFGRELS